jgi:uncharacterized protein (TIGR03437 family)
MNQFRLLRILSALFAMTLCTSYLQAASLTAGTTAINLSCTKGQTCASSNTSTLAISAGTGYFTVTPPTVPWLLVTPMAGTATTTASANILTFSVSPGWTTLGSGLNTTTVAITSAGNTSTSVTVTLQVQDATPTLIVKGGVNVLNPLAYVAGAAAPTMSLTVLSSDGLPLPFTVAAVANTTPEGVSGWLTSSTSSGIAYSWGTTISVTASAAATQQQAQPGDLLTGTVTVTPSGQTPVIVPVSITVSAGVATVTGVSPNIVPLLVTGVAPGYVTLVLKGANFVSTTGTQKTKVFLGATLAAATQVLTDNVTVLSPNYLTVAVPYSATGVPFATAGVTALVVGVANGASPAAPVGATVTLAVTAAPIISQITSASSFVDPIGTASPKTAPYDIISIFGNSLCPLCTGSNSVLVGAPDATYGRFPTLLSPDGGTHKITVTFSKPGTPATLLPGYLLFATNNQINVLVPGALTTLNNSGVNVQVGYDTATPATTANTSAVFLVTFAAQNPGVFTIASNGQGQGAITDASTFTLNGAAAGATPFADTPATGVVAIFMTGLGIPDSAGTNVATGSPVYGTNCLAPLGVVGTSSVAPTGYMGTVNTPFFGSVTGTGYSPASGYVVPAWTSIDGAVIRSAILQGNFAPCFNTLHPTVTIGGVAATVVAAGFVSDSIAGLYQINAQVPTPTDLPTYAAGTPQQYNVVVHMNGVDSQSGVTMYVQ